MEKSHSFAIMQIFIILILSVFFLVVNLSFGQKGFFMKEKEMYEKYKMSIKNFEKGKQQFHKGDYKKAEKELKKCLDIFPRHTEAHFYLSNILYNKGDFPKALEHIEEAKANWEFMARMYAFAYESYTSKLRKQRDEYQAKILNYKDKLSTTSSRDESSTLENAISSLENEISIIDSRLTNPLLPVKKIPADYFYLHGNIFFRLKKYQEAYVQYIEAIKIDPQHANAYNNLANLYYMAKQYQKALDCLKQAEAKGVKINPELKRAILKALGK